MSIYAATLENAHDPISQLFGQHSLRGRHVEAAQAQERGQNQNNGNPLGDMVFDQADTSPEALLRRMERKLECGETAAAMKIGERLLRHEDELSESVSDGLKSAMETGISDLHVMGWHTEAANYEADMDRRMHPYAPGTPQIGDNTVAFLQPGMTMQV